MNLCVIGSLGTFSCAQSSAAIIVTPASTGKLENLQFMRRSIRLDLIRFA